mgnify:CR=1 FL=1
MTDQDLNEAIAREHIGTKRWRWLHNEAWRRMLETVYPAFNEEAEHFARMRLRA